MSLQEEGENKLHNFDSVFSYSASNLADSQFHIGNICYLQLECFRMALFGKYILVGENATSMM